MSTADPPRLTYPCAYPIKVLGEQSHDFVSVVVAVVQRHDPDLREENVTVKPSSKGRYVSVNITITAQGPEHIQALFIDLKATGRVAVVL